jgi:hypothetical protein
MAPIIGVLTNPASGKNRRNPSRRRELERAVGRLGVVRQTRDLDELGGVLDEFIDAGCRYWICDGGDGTLHWLLTVGAERLRARGDAIPWPRIVPAYGGSIDFVAHKAGIRGQAVDVLRVLVHRLEHGEPLEHTSLDTMRVRGTTNSGGSFDHLGFASALGGIAQRFFGKLYERRPVDGWSIARVIGNSVAGAMVGTAPTQLTQLLPQSMRELADGVWAPTLASVEVDGRRLPWGSYAALQVGSIDISLGGVVRTFRRAQAPGVLHAQAVSTTPLGIVANLPNVVLGTPIWGSQVFDGPVERIVVRAHAGESLDPVIDGELFHDLAELRISRGPTLEVPRLFAA